MDDLTAIRADLAVILKAQDDSTKDMAAVKNAIAGASINGTKTSKGILDRLDRLEKGMIALVIAVVAILGVTGGASLLNFIQGL